MKHLSVVLFSLIALCSFAAEPIPETRAGSTFAAWLNAFNSADESQIAAFQDKYQRKRPVAGWLDYRKQTGGFEVLRVESSEPDVIRVLAKEGASGRGARLELRLQGDGLGDNITIDVRTVDLPPEFAVPRMSLEISLAALTARADEYARNDLFSGALLIARGDRVLMLKQWGFANREARAPVTAATKFRLGSMNKMFTAIAILQLAEAGKLSLDAPIAQYLPDYPNKDLAAKVRVRHLLSHTGGTGDIFEPEYFERRLQMRAHGDYLGLFGARAAEFEPGTRDRYSNYGYVLLGALIEKVSGMSYYDYVQQRIYAPAGMTATGSLPESVDVPDRALGYMRENDKWVLNTDTLPYRGTAAGGGYSTVGDMLQFARALQEGRLISKRMLAEATTPHDNGLTYGYGFGIQGEGKLRRFGHGGGAPGMNAELRIYPELDYVLVGLSNLDPNAASDMIDFIGDRLPLE